MFPAAFAVMARIRTAFADKGHDAEHHRDLRRRFGAEPHIHKRGQPHGSGPGGRRRPVERSSALPQAACIFLVAGRLAREF